MGLFNNRNQNETAYTGGKKHFTDVIKNSGPGDLLIWRQPEEDFNTNSTLIVMPGEEAIFIKNGKIQQVFKNGQYKLTTENYPFISRLRNAFSGGVSTFNCVVYFIRTAHSEEIKWGTSTPIQVRDPKLGIATSVLARGAYRVRIENAALYLEKLIGNNVQFAEQNNVINYFENQFQMYVKSLITQFITNSNAEILGICAYQMEIAIIIEPFIKKAFEEYGIELVNFSIAAMDIPMADPQRQKLENAFAEKGALKTLGTDWARIKAAEIMQTLAENPGAGGVAASGAGLGMGMAAGSVFSSIAKEMFSPFEGFEPTLQPSFGESGRFVQINDEGNGSATNDSNVVGIDYMKNLTDAKALLDAGLITQEDYNQTKNEILNKLKG